MSAQQFIKDHGVDKAREVLLSAYTHCIYVETPTHFDVNENVLVHEIDFKEMYESYVDLKKLKRLVESVELVEHFGNDLVGAKQLLEFSNDWKTIELSGSVITIERLEQAIADYEQLFGNTETLELETLRDCDTSPNCKKFDERVK